MGSSKDAGNESRLVSVSRVSPKSHVDHGGGDGTHIEAMSFTPRHFLTSWTIILSLPLSPASAVSGSATAGVTSSSTGSTRELPALSTIEAIFENEMVEVKREGVKGRGGGERKRAEVVAAAKR